MNIFFFKPPIDLSTSDTSLYFVSSEAGSLNASEEISAGMASGMGELGASGPGEPGASTTEPSLVSITPDRIPSKEEQTDSIIVTLRPEDSITPASVLGIDTSDTEGSDLIRTVETITESEKKTEDLYSESITSAYDDRLSWVKNATEIPSEKPMVDVTEPGSAKMSDHETTPLSGLSDKPDRSSDFDGWTTSEDLFNRQEGATIAPAKRPYITPLVVDTEQGKDIDSSASEDQETDVSKSPGDRDTTETTKRRLPERLDYEEEEAAGGHLIKKPKGGRGQKGDNYVLTEEQASTLVEHTIQRLIEARNRRLRRVRRSQQFAKQRKQKRRPRRSRRSLDDIQQNYSAIEQDVGDGAYQNQWMKITHQLTIDAHPKENRLGSSLFSCFTQVILLNSPKELRTVGQKLPVGAVVVSYLQQNIPEDLPMGMFVKTEMKSNRWSRVPVVRGLLEFVTSIRRFAVGLAVQNKLTISRY
ncbi:hypothetical protein FBUS_00315 [Fasciolopsis buskii]|uniref:Uncharacterized protein n=1 Tax=Fasciolopsis buskii TaxID=27845 RepID=A0A8E0VK75_9TREM|nr:hypothetical protein FBUS_00315 [Fasciolopsis buski]